MVNSKDKSSQILLTLRAEPQSSSQGCITLPYFQLASEQEEVFSYDKHLPHYKEKNEPVFQATQLPLFLAARQVKNTWLIPREEDCHALWDKYAMFEHIRRHSERVADFAHGMALIAQEQGADINADAVFAAGLLHDLGKTYCIEHGGHHAQLGAGWVMSETRHARIAQAVLYHVHWPWENILEVSIAEDALFSVFALIYADKRVKHDEYVSLEERFADLQERYGKNETARQKIQASYQQGKLVEAAFSRRFGVKLDEYIVNSRRLVKRT